MKSKPATAKGGRRVIYLRWVRNIVVQTYHLVVAVVAVVAAVDGLCDEFVVE